MSRISACFAVLLGMLFLTQIDRVQDQEFERDLQFIPVEDPSHGLRSAQQTRGGGGFALPFFDDFASPTFEGEGGPEGLLRWTGSSVRRTTNYAIQPPTIGTATLDGLRSDGYPYSFNAENTGWADTLTSVPINLAGRTPEDNIHLTFFYQGGGRGNAPDENDSLVIEFLAPDAGEFGWTQVWSAQGAEMDTFALGWVAVDNPVHLQAGFQFRFRNHGALGGNVDLWHVDYVLLDDNLDPNNLGYFEVAFVDPLHTLTEPYSIMPWSHFLSDPDGFMADSLRTLHRNMSAFQADNVTCGVKVKNMESGEEEDFLNPFSETFVFPDTTFEVNYYVQAPLVEGGDTLVDPSGFAFQAEGNDTAVVFEVSLYENPIGILEQERVGVADNDSIVFTQPFRNEYAYDDGSAEKAYGLTTGGGKLAVRYDLAIPDTLYGLAIHFTPYYDNQDNQNFLLRAWADDLGTPGDELGENFLFHQPAYFTDGNDVFAYYAYDDPIPVEGAVHVGMVQEQQFALNIGLDKNTDFNYSRVHYQLGLGAEWVLSTIPGTVMIRPVLQAGVDEVFVSVDDQGATINEMTVYPNPARDWAEVLWTGAEEPKSWRWMDLTGRTLVFDRWTAGAVKVRMSTGDLPRGLHLLVIEGPQGQMHTRKVMLN